MRQRSARAASGVWRKNLSEAARRQRQRRHASAIASSCVTSLVLRYPHDVVAVHHGQPPGTADVDVTDRYVSAAGLRDVRHRDCERYEAEPTGGRA